MPTTETRDERQSGRVLTVLFWAGVALAPLAALLLLMGSGDALLRASVGVITLAVILIGLSITLRRDSDAMRVEMEDMILDEVDAVRADVREDITVAAQTTHRAFGEKFQYVLDQLEATRAELDATRAQLDAARMQQPTPPPPGRHVPPSGPAQQQPVPGRPGVVRHTETVQVTTRHTVMDPHGEERGKTYGTPMRGEPSRADREPVRGEPTREPVRGEPLRADREPVRGEPLRGEPIRAEGPRRARDDHDESWTEQRFREQLERGRRSAAEPADEVRAGDRWASVRSDDRGREVRMGERRAALHRDESGTELRIEDRWAAVRREDREPERGFPWRDQEDDQWSAEQRAITAADREPRWTDQDRWTRERERDRDDDRDRRYR